MTRHRFETYLDKVFDFSDLVDALPEGRQFPQHAWKKVFDAVFLGAAMQIPSLLQIEAECRRGALAKRIGPISDDTIGYALQRQSPEPVFALGCEIARRLKRNGVLRSDWSRGLVVAAVDGIEICSSFVRCCDACMARGAAQGARRTAHRHPVLPSDRRRGESARLFPSRWAFASRKTAKRRWAVRWLCCRIWSATWGADSWICWWATRCICRRP